MLQSGFIDGMLGYSSSNDTRNRIDVLQTSYRCCGNYNHSDWFVIYWSPQISKTDDTVPDSCCNLEVMKLKEIPCITEVPFGEGEKLTSYTKGCSAMVAAHYSGALRLLGLFMVAASVLQGVVLALIIMEVLNFKQNISKAPKKDEEKNLIKK